MREPATPEPSEQNETTTSQSSSAPLIPVVKELQAQGSSSIPAEITQTISRVKPDIALDYVDKWVNLEYQDRNEERAHQLRLAQAKLALEEKVEANKAADRAANRSFFQNSIRWGMGIFLAVFISSLGFAIAVEDEEGKIPLTVLSITAGILGGTGIARLKGSVSDQNNANKQP
ncbi:MAG: hypothetical protein AAFV85_02275 [Cyanobacteria bacterium J06634_6]